jgi:membrane protease YdiL (CAAX protease family)
VNERLSPARAAWLLIALRARRVRNRLLALGRRSRAPAPHAPQRAGTAPKSRNSWLLAAFVGIYLPVVAFQNAGRVLTVIIEHEKDAGAALAADLLSVAAIRVVSLEAAVVMLGALLLALANREVATPEWDLEWLVTLPLPSATLLALRVLERTVVNLPGLLLAWPFFTMLAWRCGFGAAAPLAGAVAALPLLLIVATLWTIADTGLRLTLAPPRLRNLQALISLGSVAALLLALSPVTGMGGLLYRGARALPDAVVLWSPPGLAVHALARGGLGEAAGDLALLALEAALMATAGVALLAYLVRDGFVGASGRESGRGGRGSARARAGNAGDGRQPWLGPIARRELRLLGRDRNFLVQTLVMPALVIALQIYFGMRGLGTGDLLHINPQHVAAIAFGISAYAIMASAFQALNAEGHALWILYTLPHRPEALLRRKAALWTGVALIYPLIVLGVSSVAIGLTWRGLALGAIAVAGVPIFATIATSLGVFACDPTSAEIHRRLRPAYVYLYMLLAGIYTFALYASGIWQRAVLMILCALVALALWQKARDQLPYLLDPAASPPARVSLADGLIAALVFFLVQAVVALVSIRPGQSPDAAVLVKAFVWAGGVTFVIMRFAYWRTRAVGVPRLLGPRPDRALALGLAGAVAASVVGIGYLLLLRRLGRLPPTPESELGAVMAWLLPLAVVAAPVFEEFIFRGLIFGGLRRSYGVAAAVLASAGIFAIVHPPLSVVPVFAMGAVAALVYERAGMLLAPMLVHAGYNAVVLVVQAHLAR